MDKHIQEVLELAASHLRAVTLADPAAVPPMTRLSCLWATELLTAAGARAPKPSGEVVIQPADSIRAALAVLARLPAEVFADHPIVEAAAVARGALARG